jgi:large subunit ribosomal protein L28
MSARCAICGKGPQVGFNVSHSLRHTKRRFLPNLQTVRVDAGNGATLKIRVCTKCLKAGKVQRAAR